MKKIPSFSEGLRNLELKLRIINVKIIYEKDGKIGRITLNRPEVLNAIDSEIPKLLSECVNKANADASVHVIVLSGAGNACSGYDLKAFAKEPQIQPRNAMGFHESYNLMKENTTTLCRYGEVADQLCKINGYALAGGSDLALCSDLIFMEETGEIGYMPSRVWGARQLPCGFIKLE